MTALRRGLDGLEKALWVIGGATLAGMTGVLLLQVFLRYVMNNPTSWSEEFATLCFVWCVMLAIPLGLRHQEHISMEYLVDKLAGARWRWAKALLNIVVGATMVAIGVASFGLFGSGLRQVLPGMSMSFDLDVPLLVMYIAVPIGCFASGLFALEQVLRILRGEIAPREGSRDDDTAAPSTPQEMI